MPPRIETQAEPIPGYRLIERLGGGGFGEVWKAEAPGGLMKAIKFVYGDLQTVGDADTARAEQELKALSRVKTVRHPFILSLERFDIQDGQLMIVSELADRNLWDRFRECRSQSLPGIPRVELLKFMQETAEALDHMNLELDLMHLDIKPQNLFLVGSHIKVADFGLVKDLEGLVASVTGGVTPVYAAPETFEGYVSRFSDQYSLAIVYQELLTGHRPFNANNTRQLIMAHLQGEPDLSSLPPSDRPFIARSLAKDPNQRYPNCQSLVRALVSVGEGTARSAYRPDLQDTPFAAPPTTMSREEAELGPNLKTPTPPKPKKTPSSASVLDFSPLNGTNTASLVRTSAVPLLPAPPTLGLPEELGDGVLMPALVIGLGQVGRSMLERFRAELRSRHGDLSRLPHVRLLGIDSDPTPAPPLADAEALAADETLLTRLSRPGRYLRGRNGLPSLDDWLEPTMLYRIPRDLATNGIRALGRLAFIDNYRAILSRLRWDLEQITARAALAAAAEHTGMQLRSSWPRVYLLAHLGGGTGSGSLLDLAFVVRHVLRMLRIGRQEVHGVFVLPPAELAPGMDLCLANAHAALAELGRYMTVGQKFEGRYEARVAPIKDHGPAFARCVFLQGGAEGEPQRFREIVHSASDWLYRELLTPLGRTTAIARGEIASESGQKSSKLLPGRTTPYLAYGLSAVILPRQTVVRRVARRALSHVIEQWAGKAAPDRAAQFQLEMQRDCLALKVDPQTVITRFHAACQEQLEHPPDVLFSSWMVPMRQLTNLGLPEPKAYHDALLESDRMLGVYDPKASTAIAPMIVGDNPCVMPRILREAAEVLVNQFELPLVSQVLRFLDVPGERLGGAEEAVTQTIACLEDWLRTLELQQDQIVAFLKELPDRIRRDLAECDRLNERARRGLKITAERRQLAINGVPERIQRLIILRYQLLTLQWTIAVYRSLRGRLSDQKKEIAYVRGRLRDLQARFLSELSGTTAEEALPRWKFVFPDRAERLDQVVEPALRRLTPEDWGELDLALQRTLDDDLGGLLRACQTGGQTHFERLCRSLEQSALSCLMSRLQFDDVAAILLAEGNETMHLQNYLGRLRDEASPEFMPGPGCTTRELTVVIAPDTPAGQRLLDAARKGITGVQLVAAANREEIAFYREVGGIALTDLPQFGAKGKQAYDAAFAVEHFTPHARQDVPEWAAKKKKDG